MKNKVNSQKSLISVIMPVYNAGQFLVEAIESILEQTYKNFELIIVDDASTDNSWEIIKSYQKQYPRKIKAIKMKKNSGNSGGCAAANIAYKSAQGQFIARMDSDDIAHSKRFEKQVKYLLKNPDTIMIGSQAYIIDATGKVTGEKKVPTTSEAIYKRYAVVHPMIHPSIMINRALLPKRKNLYLIKYAPNDDYLTFFELLQHGRFANLAEKLLYYRIHMKNNSLIHLKSCFFNTAKIRIEAIKRFGYQPGFNEIFVAFAQLMVVLILPEKLLYTIYFYSLGLMPGFENPFKRVLPSLGKIKELALNR